jgi:DNA invertase Pin-like site-specific DNA recombinase
VGGGVKCIPQNIEREMSAEPITRGVRFGAKPKLSKQDLLGLVREFEAPGCSKAEIAEHYGITRSSVYRLYAENRQRAENVPAVH